MSQDGRCDQNRTLSACAEQQHVPDRVARDTSDDLSGVVNRHHNGLLKAFPTDVWKRLLPFLHLERLSPGRILYDFRRPLRQVWFPVDSVVSLQCMAESGSSAELYMVGNEGLVGLFTLLGSDSTTGRALVLNAGLAYVLPAQRMRNEFNTSSETRRLVLRYTQSLMTGMAQTAFCNRYHSISQQLCRWLLMSLDRLPSEQMNITQEMIANVLGVRVASINEAACKLQKLGVIEYCRGRVTVLDRSQLEKITCECYTAVKNETERLEHIPRSMVLVD